MFMPMEDEVEKETSKDDVDNGDTINEENINLNNYESNINITKGGEYNISGSFNYSLIVNSPEKVILNLNNVTINSEITASIANINSGELVINLPSGTSSTLKDKGSSEYDGCIYSSGKLTIKGEGKLYVYGNQEEGEGIATTDNDITINGGEIYIESADDGLNAGGDNGGTITINDGNIYIKASGDGIDSNKNLIINDGKVYTMGSSIGGDAGIDTDGSFEINGGEVIALGSDMLQNPDKSSQQKYVSFTLNSKISKGSTISLKDSKDNEMISFTADEDFSNAIYAQEPSTALIWKDDPNHDLREYHYFKIKDGIRVKTKDELEKTVGIDIPYSVHLISDDEGVTKYASTDTSCDDTSYRDTEQLILKFANRISVDEAYECHKKLIADYIKQQELQCEKWKKEMEEERIELQKLYESKKNNPSYFPGVNGHFVHNDNESKNLEKEKYTLLQIKEFYQKLKTLNPDIVKEMCFYGGTIPYILNDASESRDFGDIDIFVPVPQMEKLRGELAKQDSFEMICDSKPLAQFCHLTSKIQKKSTELVDKNQQTNEFLGLMLNAMTTPQGEDIIDVDQNGNAYNPFEEFFSRTRPYYNKTQDFGFKAKLFGINISVFPIYQYENNIMAKSFNINEMYRFLLGVRVLNNATIDDFVRNVELYDSMFKVLPLEYTLVSKKSAVDEQYSFRLEKDREDIEYILSHKEELGIDDEKIQEILSKYPDYSISIAYKVNDNGTTSTMGGATYKELVLTNRHIS